MWPSKLKYQTALYVPNCDNICHQCPLSVHTELFITIIDLIQEQNLVVAPCPCNNLLSINELSICCSYPFVSLWPVLSPLSNEFSFYWERGIFLVHIHAWYSESVRSRQTPEHYYERGIFLSLYIIWNDRKQVTNISLGWHWVNCSVTNNKGGERIE